MIEVHTVTSPIVLCAVVASAWGFVDALNRPESVFQAAQVSKWAWVAAFGALAILVLLSGVGTRVIHAPYLLKSLNALFLLGASASAVTGTALYIFLVRRSSLTN
jgi:hypothetical protein